MALFVALIVEPAIAAGSISGPNISPKVPEANQQKGEVSNSLLLVQELERLQAKIKDHGQPISLGEAISQGIENNPQLLEAFSTIQQYEWQLISAKRKWYPTLALNNGTPFVGYNWSTFIQDQYVYTQQITSSSSTATQNGSSSSTATATQNGSSSSTATATQSSSTTPQQMQRLGTKSQTFVFRPGAIASWNFIDPTRQPNINSASESLKQQKLLFSVSARNLILNLQKSYFQVQSNQELIKSFKQIYAINRQQLDTLEARKSIGMVTVLDVEQTRSQLFSQLSTLILYTKNYIDATASLAELLALPPGRLAIPIESAEPQGSWEKSLSQTIKAALLQREEILASLAAAESAKWTGISSLRNYLPVVQLVGTGSLQFTNGYQMVPVNQDPGHDYGRSRTWDAAAGIGFNWSIFDGGINAASAQASFAQSRQLKASAATTELEVVRQVQSSYGQMETSLVAIESAHQAYKSAELAQEASRARFSVGVGDITSVVQTIQQLSTASQQVAEAVLNYNNAIADLYRYSAVWPMDTSESVSERLTNLRQISKP